MLSSLSGTRVQAEGLLMIHTGKELANDSNRPVLMYLCIFCDTKEENLYTAAANNS